MRMQDTNSNTTIVSINLQGNLSGNASTATFKYNYCFY